MKPYTKPETFLLAPMLLCTLPAMGEHLARSLKVRGKEEVSWEFRFMEKAEGKREKAWVPKGGRVQKHVGLNL